MTTTNPSPDRLTTTDPTTRPPRFRMAAVGLASPLLLAACSSDSSDTAGDRLLAAVAGIPGGTAQLSVHDLTSGEQLALVDFASVLADDLRFTNGITVGDDGTIYVTGTGAR